MTKREMLLRKLSTAQFALWELHLYLNTHPTDLEALALHEKYEIKCAKPESRSIRKVPVPGP